MLQVIPHTLSSLMLTARGALIAMQWSSSSYDGCTVAESRWRAMCATNTARHVRQKSSSMACTTTHSQCACTPAVAELETLCWPRQPTQCTCLEAKSSPWTVCAPAAARRRGLASVTDFLPILTGLHCLWDSGLSDLRARLGAAPAPELRGGSEPCADVRRPDTPGRRPG